MIQQLYLTILHTSTVIFILVAALLFLRHRDGNRSRIILGFVILLSVANCLPRLIAHLSDTPPLSITTVPTLLFCIFIIVAYIVYSIEVVSPRWLDWGRALAIYAPFVGLVLFYQMTLWSGVEYREVHSLLDMIPVFWNFDILFRVLLFLIIVGLLIFTYITPRLRPFRSFDKRWIRGYSIAVSIKICAILTVLLINDLRINAGYYLFSVGSCLYIVYQELFVLPRASDDTSEEVAEVQPSDEDNTDEQSAEPTLPDTPMPRRIMLWSQMEEYMQRQEPWRSPDMSVSVLADAVKSNRTTIAETIKEAGYESFYDYVSQYRIREFCRQAKEGSVHSVVETLYGVGFRSRSVAFAQFKRQMNVTPGEYLKTLKP